MEREKILLPFLDKKISNQTTDQHVLFHCIPLWAILLLFYKTPKHFIKMHFELNWNGLVKHTSLKHLKFIISKMRKEKSNSSSMTSLIKKKETYIVFYCFKIFLENNVRYLYTFLHPNSLWVSDSFSLCPTNEFWNIWCWSNDKACGIVGGSLSMLIRPFSFILEIDGLVRRINTGK